MFRLDQHGHYRTHLLTPRQILLLLKLELWRWTIHLENMASAPKLNLIIHRILIAVFPPYLVSSLFAHPSHHHSHRHFYTSSIPSNVLETLVQALGQSQMDHL